MQSFEKDWDMEAKFLSGDLHPVLQLDATVASHAIVVDVDTPDQINAVFDMIAYNKGTCHFFFRISHLVKSIFQIIGCID